MKDPCKPRRSRIFILTTTLPLARWTTFRGEAPILTWRIADLLREQMQLLETTDMLSDQELERYEARSEHISELIRLLPEE